MKNKIFLPALFLLLSLTISSIKLQAQADTTNRITGVPKLTYGFKLNLINLVYNPFYYADNAFFINYPSPALLIKDFKNNTHEIEINQFTIDRFSKDVYYQNIAVLYQYDANLSKVKDLKLMPMIAPYFILGFESSGSTDSLRGRYFTNELYAKLGIGAGARYNINSKTFIDIIPSIKLTHFYWLSGRVKSNPQPESFSENQLLKFEFKDVFFKIGLGHWF